LRQRMCRLRRRGICWSKRFFSRLRGDIRLGQFRRSVPRVRSFWQIVRIFDWRL